jgi:DNA invertase Pin-like site-specific DNA recombinase
MKIAAYVRVSTKDQSPDIQINDVKKYCALKDWGDPVLFIDHGESGAKTSRPAFDEMMTRVRAGEFGAVLAWKFDRIGRSSIHLIEVMTELKGLAVDFISIKENIDTTSAMGKLIFTIFAALAEFERDAIRMRTKTGQDLARSRGVHCGRPAVIGSEIKKDIIYLRGQGHTLDELCQIHPTVSRSTIYRIIKGN